MIQVWRQVYVNIMLCPITSCLQLPQLEAQGCTLLLATPNQLENQIVRSKVVLMELGCSVTDLHFFKGRYLVLPVHLIYNILLILSIIYNHKNPDSWSNFSDIFFLGIWKHYLCSSPQSSQKSDLDAYFLIGLIQIIETGIVLSFQEVVTHFI